MMNKKQPFDRLFDLLEQKKYREEVRKEFPQEVWSSFCNTFDFLEAQKDHKAAVPDPKGLQNVLAQVRTVPSKPRSYKWNPWIRFSSYATACGLALVVGMQISGPVKEPVFESQPEPFTLATRSSFVALEEDFSADFVELSSNGIIESAVEIDSLQAELDALYGELEELEDIQETQLFSFNRSWLDIVFPTAYADQGAEDKVKQKIKSLEVFIQKVQTVFPHADQVLKDSITQELQSEIAWWKIERNLNDTDVLKSREKALKEDLGSYISQLKRSSLKTLLAKRKLSE